MEAVIRRQTRSKARSFQRGDLEDHQPLQRQKTTTRLHGHQSSPEALKPRKQTVQNPLQVPIRAMILRAVGLLLQNSPDELRSLQKPKTITKSHGLLRKPKLSIFFLQLRTLRTQSHPRHSASQPFLLVTRKMAISTLSHPSNTSPKSHQTISSHSPLPFPLPNQLPKHYLFLLLRNPALYPEKNLCVAVVPVSSPPPGRSSQDPCGKSNREVCYLQRWISRIASGGGWIWMRVGVVEEEMLLNCEFEGSISVRPHKCGRRSRAGLLKRREKWILRMERVTSLPFCRHHDQREYSNPSLSSEDLLYTSQDISVNYSRLLITMA